jgi:hypothetical protein
MSAATDVAVPARHIVGNAAVRRMCGGITRHTLIQWRGKDFPAPIPARRAGVDLWDAREVRAWYRARRTRPES